MMKIFLKIFVFEHSSFYLIYFLDTARRVPTNYYTISHKFLTPCHDDRLYITLYYFGLSRNTLNFDNLLIS